VSRSTVVQAFTQLRAEGYIDSISRGSTRVSARLPDGLVRADPPPTVRKSAGKHPEPSRPRCGNRRVLATLHRRVRSSGSRLFAPACQALDIFPMDVWGRLMSRRWRRSPAAALSYAEPRGLPALREAVATTW
jgi:GntR family transcriptional regulator/MocR family aminotransferase